MVIVNQDDSGKALFQETHSDVDATDDSTAIQ